jgi:prevent-host-death family protein
MDRVLPISPITDLRSQAKEILKQAQSQPVVITQNGRPSAVLLNYKSYNALIEMMDEFKRLREQEREQWSLASAEALQRVWDNPADAAYDNWKALYGL